MRAAPTNTRRMVSATLVLLLHLLLLLVLLHSVIRPNRPAAMREIFFSFPPRSERATPLPPPPLPAMAAPPRAGVPSGAAPSLETPDVRGLGQALFGCAPENLGSLTPEQRSHCTNGLARHDAGSAPSTHVKDAARWEGELKARNTPGRIPCTYIAVTPAVAGGGDTKVPMAEFVCLHKLLSD